MGKNMKLELVNKTYEILKNEGMGNIKIRRIASEVGCTSTVIYKHFDDLDHLLALASVRSLKDYIVDYLLIASERVGTIDIHTCLWRSFAEYAFEDIEMFEMLFIGKFKSRLEELIVEYFELFRDEFADMEAMEAVILFNNDVFEREFILLRRDANNGYLDFNDVGILTKTVVYTFFGFLSEYKHKSNDTATREAGVEEFMTTLNAIMSRYRRDYVDNGE